MSNSKQERPTLQGQRIKTRKRDEKEKYDPTAFRDAILLGLNDANGDLDQVSKFLDTAGNKVDYRRYNEPLLDILFAGGILAPGGSIVGDDAAEDGQGIRSSVCVFNTAADYASLKRMYEVFYKLIRRYKYLEKQFEEELKKLLLFLKGFAEDHRCKLGMFYGICFANNLGNTSCLHNLLDDHLVKEGLAMEFATNMFRSWLTTKDINHVATMLKKGQMDTQLMMLLPINKRTMENFENHFKTAGLEPVIDYQRSRQKIETRIELQSTLDTMIKEGDSPREIEVVVKEEMKKNEMTEQDVLVMLWNIVMNSVEWNKKDDLAADQALKHLKFYAPLLASLSRTEKAEMALLNKIQDFCYENMVFMKVFKKIVMLFYKAEIIGENTILKWYDDSHSSKGKSSFLEQMKDFVEWLKNAEEESDDDDEEED